MSTLTLHKPQGQPYATSLSPTGTGHALHAGPMRRFAARVGRWFAMALAHQRANRAIAELQSLDDRLLRDIGLSRSTLHHVVHARMQQMINDLAHTPAHGTARNELFHCDCPDCRRLR